MKKIILPITPQTWVRIKSGLRGDQVLFRIPEVCFKGENDGPCEEYLASLRTVKGQEVGFCKHTLTKGGRDRKRRIERYNKYRMDLFFLAKQAGFKIPTCGWGVYFYFPMPVAWSNKKKAKMNGQMKLSKPDQSNLLKAFEDALSLRDEQIGQMSGLGKFWSIDGGRVEILLGLPVYNPLGVELIDMDKEISMTDIMERREARTARRQITRPKKKKDKEKLLPPPKKLSRKIILKNDIIK